MKHIILLHGAIGSKEQLQPLADKLKDNFIVHTLSFSGHGGEGMIEEFNIKNFAANVIAYLSKNNIEKINVFGYSMGGYVALYLAKHYPEKIIKVFSFAAKFHWTPEISRQEVKMMDAAKIEEKIPSFAKTLQQRHYPNDWKIVLQKISEMLTRVGAQTPLTENEFETIDQPILLGIGDKDATVTLEETIYIYHKLKYASLVVFLDTPHPIEKISMERLSNEIIKFF